MFTLLVTVLITAHYSFCQNTNNSERSYYFKMGKNANEFRVNNRVYFLNHNITDYDYTHRRVDRTQQQTEFGLKQNNYDSTYFLDDEWKFDHENLSKSELPMFIHKFYEEMSSDVKKVHRILFNVNRNNSSNIIKFNLNSLNNHEEVLDGEFYFYWPLETSSEIYRKSVVLRLYQFEKQLTVDINESTLIENPDIHKLFNVIYISKAQRGWQIFKIKKPIANWLNDEDNLGLLLTISSYDDNKLLSVFNDTNAGIYRSFAVVTVRSNETFEKNIENKEVQDTESTCQKKEWFINFKKLHWDNFIISPDGFMAYDCIGKCWNSRNDNVNHVKFLRIFNKRPSCCIPLNYLPMPVMFYDKLGNVVIKNYEKMIVAKCGCR